MGEARRRKTAGAYLEPRIQSVEHGRREVLAASAAARGWDACRLSSEEHEDGSVYARTRHGFRRLNPQQVETVKLARAGKIRAVRPHTPGQAA